MFFEQIFFFRLLFSSVLKTEIHTATQLSGQRLYWHHKQSPQMLHIIGSLSSL